MNEQGLLTTAHQAYDDRDVETLVSVVDPDVDRTQGPDDPRRLHGREAVRTYWLQQWAYVVAHAVTGSSCPRSIPRGDHGFLDLARRRRAVGAVTGHGFYG